MTGGAICVSSGNGPSQKHRWVEVKGSGAAQGLPHPLVCSSQGGLGSASAAQIIHPAAFYMSQQFQCSLFS